jgi:metallo-beta-lactamase family protein
MAGSGMCTGGRVLHHLRHNLPIPEAAVLIVGFNLPEQPVENWLTERSR